MSHLSTKLILALAASSTSTAEPANPFPASFCLPTHETVAVKAQEPDDEASLSPQAQAVREAILKAEANFEIEWDFQATPDYKSNSGASVHLDFSQESFEQLEIVRELSTFMKVHIITESVKNAENVSSFFRENGINPQSKNINIVHPDSEEPRKHLDVWAQDWGFRSGSTILTPLFRHAGHLRFSPTEPGFEILDSVAKDIGVEKVVQSPLSFVRGNLLVAKNKEGKLIAFVGSDAYVRSKQYYDEAGLSLTEDEFKQKTQKQLNVDSVVILGTKNEAGTYAEQPDTFYHIGIAMQFIADGKALTISFDAIPDKETLIADFDKAKQAMSDYLDNLGVEGIDEIFKEFKELKIGDIHYHDAISKRSQIGRELSILQDNINTESLRARDQLGLIDLENYVSTVYRETLIKNGFDVSSLPVEYDNLVYKPSDASRPTDSPYILSPLTCIVSEKDGKPYILMPIKTKRGEAYPKRDAEGKFALSDPERENVERLTKMGCTVVVIPDTGHLVDQGGAECLVMRY